jgi:hypothetical protein
MISYYCAGGLLSEHRVLDGSFGFTADSGTTVTISGMSFGSNLNEKWCFSSTCPDITFPAAAATFSYVYHEYYYVTFVASPTGGGTVPSSEWYIAGSNPIASSPNSGYLFSQWGSSTALDSFSSTTSQSTNAMIAGPGTITANFVSVISAPQFPLVGSLAGVLIPLLAIALFGILSSRKKIIRY